MTYFATQYKKLSYPVRKNDIGLYNAQLGAIHSIGAHFTINNMPGIVTMPTGSGKTAVLMMAPFLLQSKRILIITPSRMVRGQIYEDVKDLKVLKTIGVVPKNIPLPKVSEVKNKITSDILWENLKDYDIVIATPNCISPSFKNIPKPPKNLFDLILVDEAHHSPAKTWQELLNTFGVAKKILFTATPFRRDKKEISGKFIYTYPLTQAHTDGIFGNIAYVHVKEPPNEKDNDVAISKEAQKVFQEDSKNGLEHSLMVRTDSKKKATELLEIYKTNTTLRLELIHSGISFKKSQLTLDKLKQKSLDGIICVDMLGEGFNFPNLKIAAIHTPHKSLEVTLQFIGRFARTNARNIGQAKFIAIPSEIEIEGKQLFKDDAVWQDVIANMSALKITDETETREMLQEFAEPTSTEDDIKDLSLYSLYPRNHVKIYKVSDQLNLEAIIPLEDDYEVTYKSLNDNASVLVLIINEIRKPKWIKVDKLIDNKYDLFVIYHDTENNLLYINSSRSVDGLYTSISTALDPSAKGLPTSVINKVLKGLNKPNYFNIGMRTISANNNAESYRIISGGSTQDAIKKSDSRLFRQGHAFCTAEDATNGQKVNIGFSSASKVWSGSSSQIPKLIKWCQMLSGKLISIGKMKTNTRFDDLDAGEVVTKIPSPIIDADWDSQAYDFINPLMAEYEVDSTNRETVHITDLEIKIDKKQTNQDKIIFSILGDKVKVDFKFTLGEFYQAIPETDAAKIILIQGDRSISLLDFLNHEAPISFYMPDFSLLRNNELFKANFEDVFFDAGQVFVEDWNGVNIQNEIDEATKDGISIHEFVKNKLLADPNNKIIFYDHGKGEIADFVVVRETEHDNIVQLYHCKKSGSAVPSNRVEDIYEVCGQASRSIIWRSQKKLTEKIGSRGKKKPEKYLRGSLKEFTAIFEETKNRKMEIIIVQPGISKEAIDTNISNNLGATNDIILSGACERLIVWSSK